MELKTARLTLLVDPAKKAAFEQLCARQDLTPSQVVRQLIRDYLALHGVSYRPSGSVEQSPRKPARAAPPRAAKKGTRARPGRRDGIGAAHERRQEVMHWLHLDWVLVVVAAWLLVGTLGVFALRRLRFVARVLFPVGGLIGLALFGLALGALFGGPEVAVLPIGLPTLPFHLRLDSLSAFFLMVIGATSAGISAFAAGYFRKGEGTPPGLLCLEYHVFLASMVGVVLADDAYAFMVMWETMALSSFFLVTANHRIPEVRSAGYLYLLVAHVGAIGILLCFGVLQANTGDYTFANMRAQALSPFWASIALRAGGVRLRRQGRHPAAARLAARGAPGGAVAGVGADERGDAQDRDLRPAARDLRPAAHAAVVVGRACCWRSAWPRPCSAWSSPRCRST